MSIPAGGCSNGFGSSFDPQVPDYTTICTAPTLGHRRPPGLPLRLTGYRAGQADSDYDLIVVAESFRSVPRLRRGIGLRDLFYEVGGDAALDLICMMPDEFEGAKGRITLVSAVLPEAIDLLAEEPAPA